MCVTSIRTMSVLLFLPLLLAQRHPISLRSRGSILRRMPIFYGKRDPSMAAPSLPSASLPELPDSSLQHLPAARLGSVSPDSDLVLYTLGLSARSGQGDDDRDEKTAKQRPASDKRSGGDAGERPPWTAPSVLLTKLHDYINDKDGTTNNRELQTHPQFPGPRTWQQSDQSGTGYGRGPVHKNRTEHLSHGSLDPTERLRSRLELLSEALNYNKGHDHENFFAGDESNLEMIPLELSKAGGTKDLVDYGYDGIVDNTMGADVGDDLNDDEKSYDDDSITRFQDSGVNEDPWWVE